MRQTKATFTIEMIGLEQVVVEYCPVSWKKRGRKPKPLAPGAKSVEDYVRLSRESLYVEGEDYLDAVCLILPTGHATLIDSSVFEEFASRKWSVMKDNIFWIEHIVKPKKWGVRRCDHHHKVMRIMSREVMRLSGVKPGHKHAKFVDHISRSRWNNRLKNLRWATPSQNMQNVGPKRNRSSKYKGVSWSKEKRKWKATGYLAGKTRSLGLHDSEIDAALAYNEFVKVHFPDFGYLNTFEPSAPNRLTDSVMAL